MAIFINGARDGGRPRSRRNRGVTPGDFNERIGVLFDASSHGASSDLQFQLDPHPFSFSFVRGRGEGGRKEEGEREIQRLPRWNNTEKSNS